MRTMRNRTTTILAAGALLFGGAPALAESGEARGAGAKSESMQGQQEKSPQGKNPQAKAQVTQRSIVLPVHEISAGELAADPSAYYGRMVRVKAGVEKTYDPHTFTLDEDRLGARPDVLVLNPTPARAPETDGDVTVIGMVRPFVQTEIERDFDWFGATSEQFTVELRTRPVIVAASIQNEDGDQLVDAEAQNPHRSEPGTN